MLQPLVLAKRSHVGSMLPSSSVLQQRQLTGSLELWDSLDTLGNAAPGGRCQKALLQMLLWCNLKADPLQRHEHTCNGSCYLGDMQMLSPCSAAEILQGPCGAHIQGF